MLVHATARRKSTVPRRPGFTLVEMLVVVALVLIMMSMFANIFVTLTSSLSAQRGVAENDQRGRLLSMTIRGDVDRRTFRDLQPFRANEDTRQLGRSLARRAGYFEIDEGDPNSDIDDVLQFTASVNIQLQSKDTSPYIGNAATGLSLVSVTPSGNTFLFSDGGAYLNKIAVGSRVWTAIPGYPNVPYLVVSQPILSGGNTMVTVSPTISATGTISLYLSENDPDFDDGVFGNSIATSALAEVCYFLRNGNLYRRILLIRDKQPGGDSQPTTSTGFPILWNGSSENYPPAPSTSTFWRDFDYSAFYYTGNSTSGTAPGVRFHNASESLGNSNQIQMLLTNSNFEPASNLPFSLGVPNWRFGHSNISGLAQDLSTTATLTTGGTVTIGRFTTQECSDSTFGYPGYLPNDPISNTVNTNPFDRQNILVDSASGMVVEYTTKFNNVTSSAVNVINSTPNTNRRGADLLMSNVLTFDVKVWDPYNSVTGGVATGAFVDIGNTMSTTGVFCAHPASSLASGPNVVTDTGLATGNIVGGRLNSAYCGVATGPGYYRFDTWHPNAYTVSTASNNEPPYYNLSTMPAAPYSYNEPPYVPWAVNPATGLYQAAPLTAIQIRINYRDVSSNQVRQMTIVESLVDRLKSPSVTNEAPEE